MTFPSRLCPRGDCTRTRQCWLTIGLLAVACGCRQHGPVGRCGLPELCDPVVLEDPLPNDCCVPMKGVNPTHFGYSRPQWRVLGDRNAICCTPAVEQVEQLEVPPGAQEQLPLNEASNPVPPTGDEIDMSDVLSKLTAPPAAMLSDEKGFDVQEVVVAELPSTPPKRGRANHQAVGTVR